MKETRKAPAGKSRARQLGETALFLAAMAVAVLLLAKRFGLFSRVSAPTPAPEPTVRVGPNVFRVELAAYEEARRVGLSKRSSIDADRGMLFVYPAERPESAMSFWMKDCWMDIDIAFINADRKIVTIHTMKCEPRGTTDRDLKNYPPAAPAQFALEVRAGEFARRGIKPGDAVQFSPEVESAVPTARP